jgi:hypothetical protein
MSGYPGYNSGARYGGAPNQQYPNNYYPCEYLPLLPVAGRVMFPFLLWRPC